MNTNLVYAEWSTVLTGLGLGCLATGLSGFPTERAHLERALMKAWPEWPGKDAYPYVVPRDYGIYAIRSTLIDPQGYVAWEWEHGIRPALAVASADAADALAQFAAGQPVAVAGWEELAKSVTALLPPAS
jgi:hypothetical protein